LTSRITAKLQDVKELFASEKLTGEFITLTLAGEKTKELGHGGLLLV
jgi:hypothetical protein